MTITTTIAKNPKPNKLLTLYGEFEYQIIDFVVNSFKISKQCGKVLRGALLATTVNIITVMLTLKCHLNCSSHGRWKKKSPLPG